LRFAFGGDRPREKRERKKKKKNIGKKKKGLVLCHKKLAEP